MLGPEARGFILGAAIAVEAGVGFVPARRPGKLPPETVSARYLLEYGENSLELHPELIRPGCRVVLHDDVLATGGTIAAIKGLVESVGGDRRGCLLHHRPDVPRRARAPCRHRRLLAHLSTDKRSSQPTIRGGRLHPNMFDALTSSYTFSCPLHGETHVRLSRFRRLEQLPGPQHPAVFRVEFACGCGSEHPGLVTHADLDLTPLGLQDDTPFLNLMTSRLESVGGEFGALAAARIKAGEWPWSFFCWPEARPRPVFPSAFKLLAPSAGDDRVVARRAVPGVRPRVA